MADDTVEAARRTLLIEIDTCLERAFAQQGKGSGYIVERLDTLIAAVRAEQSKGPAGSFGYCPVCYHPLDRCSNCG